MGCSESIAELRTDVDGLDETGVDEPGPSGCSGRGPVTGLDGGGGEAVDLLKRDEKGLDSTRVDTEDG